MRSAHTRIAYACLAVALVLGACYDVPHPECGFTCGPPAIAGGEGTCPDGYVCATSLDNRCHRASPPFTDPCPGDGGIPPDLKPPLLGGHTPADGDVDVDPNAPIDVFFDESVDSILQFGNFTVFDNQGSQLVGNVQPAGGGPNEVHYQFTPTDGSGLPIPLRTGTLFRVVLSDQITDIAGNAFAGATWSFTTRVDNESPTAFVQIPTVTSLVPVDTQITVVFSEFVVGIGSGTFTVTGPSGNIGGNVTPNGTTASATFDPFVNLLPDTTYTVNLSSAITDLTGNPLSFTPFVFTTAPDVSPPMVQTVTPANNSTGLSVTTNVSVVFSELVTNLTSSTFTLTGPSGIELASVTNGGTSGLLNPVHQLLPFTTYTVALSTAILDASSNPLAAFTSMFTTGADAVPPAVIGRVPALNAINVPVNTIVRTDFDEDVTNADATTIQLVAGTAVPATVAYQGAPTFRATLTPSQQLAANTTYTVSLASTLRDVTGNMFGTPPTTWTFTTGNDTIVPAVVSTLPVDDAIDVAVTDAISVTFDEPVTNVDDTSFVVMNAGTGTLASSNGGRTWTFTPDAPMTANTMVTILLTTAIEDAAGNALAAPVTFDFTTAP